MEPIILGFMGMMEKTAEIIIMGSYNGKMEKKTETTKIG